MMAVSRNNNYTLEKALKCQKYLREIGKNKRNFPVDKLVAYHNEIKGTNYSADGCKPCLANKLYNSLQNYFAFAKAVLINNKLATEEDFIPKAEVEKEKVVELKPTEEVEEEKVVELKPKKKTKKEKDDVSDNDKQ